MAVRASDNVSEVFVLGLELNVGASQSAGWKVHAVWPKCRLIRQKSRGIFGSPVIWERRTRRELRGSTGRSNVRVVSEFTIAAGAILQLCVRLERDEFQNGDKAAENVSSLWEPITLINRDIFQLRERNSSNYPTGSENEKKKRRQEKR